MTTVEVIIILAGVPFVLWWWNFLKKQLRTSGLVGIASNIRYHYCRCKANRSRNRSVMGGQ